jgi:hypothetical protein
MINVAAFGTSFCDMSFRGLLEHYQLSSHCLAPREIQPLSKDFSPFETIFTFVTFHETPKKRKKMLKWK